MKTNQFGVSWEDLDETLALGARTPSTCVFGILTRSIHPGVLRNDEGVNLAGFWLIHPIS